MSTRSALLDAASILNGLYLGTVIDSSSRVDRIREVEAACRKASQRTRMPTKAPLSVAGQANPYRLVEELCGALRKLLEDYDNLHRINNEDRECEHGMNPCDEDASATEARAILAKIEQQGREAGLPKP